MTCNAIRLAAIAACLAVGPASAHHGYAQYDRCKSVMLEGEVTSVLWANPHIVIDLKTKDVGDYRVEWFSLTNLEQAAIGAKLNAGEHVVVTGSVMRDPALKVMSLVSEIRRPSDGWGWTRAPRPAPTGCQAA